MSSKKTIGSVRPATPDDAWMIERDLNTLIEAEQIRKDAKRMARVRKLAKEKAELMETTLDTEPNDKD